MVRVRVRAGVCTPETARSSLPVSVLKQHTHRSDCGGYGVEHTPDSSSTARSE